MRVEFGYGAKAAPNQVRGGIDVLYRTWQNVDVGGSVDVGFLKQSLYAFGPTFVYHEEWPHFEKIRFSPLGGMRYFYVSGGGITNHYFGLHVGLSTYFDVFENSSILLNVGADILLIGADVISIPVVAGLGIAFSF